MSVGILWLGGLSAWASGLPGAWPTEVATAGELRAGLSTHGRAWQSPLVVFEDGGTRVGVLLQAPADAPLRLQARGADEAGVTTDWQSLDRTWRGGDGHEVWVTDLPGWQPGAQIRVWGLDHLDDRDLFAWELLVPVDEPRAAGPPPPAVSAGLEAIGVVPREDWGADSTTCTSTESDWYRFAIHHTAGNQTSSGTVQGSVQALQAYAMGSGGYCDIPYQFVVGYDGSLWEGRNLQWYSGATGSGNNDGNIAISFLGCYDADDCGSSYDEVTLPMMGAARLLAQTLADEHDTETSDELLMGHKDYPNASTACPGDLVHPRLDELRSATAHFEGELVDTAWGDDTVTIEVGTVESGWIEIANTGLETWTSNTRLAPLPRDEASDLAADTWIADHRISAPETDTAPGETARFPLELSGASLGSYTLSLALVEESVTWFPDIPVGGGPAEGDMVLDIEVVELGGDDGGSGDDGGDDGDADDTGGSGGGSGGGGTSSAGPTGSGPDGVRVAASEIGGCGCAQATGAAPAGVALVGLLGLVRRRRVRRPGSAH